VSCTQGEVYENDVADMSIPSFGGASLPSDILSDRSRWGEIDVPGFVQKNSREIREPEIFACAKELRSKFKKVGAIGFCYGGWAVFRLGTKGNDLVDCISTGHPSLLTKDDVDNVGVPAQLLAPEFDEMYTAEMKQHTFTKLQELGVPFDYQHFPGVEHACFVRGNPKKKGEREAMARAKNAAVSWFVQHLQSA
jgi:dienelactone hydrolase